jgi:hypothetical protein
MEAALYSFDAGGITSAHFSIGLYRALTTLVMRTFLGRRFSNMRAVEHP